VASDPGARIAAGCGKSLVDLLRLRQGLPGCVPDAVLHPRHRRDLEGILACCARHGIAMTARGGASSVTQGLACPGPGVALDLRTHMDRILAFNAACQTVTVQPGRYGPALERALERAPELFGAAHRYTCGHFPQSFQFSTVGGWAATRGAGQNSTYFGKIEDLVLAQEMVTPAGVLRTGAFPAAATGPDTDQLLLGSEGAFGVLSELTLRVFRRTAEPRRFSYLLPDWAAALGAAREILQDQAGQPSLFRLSDPEETGLLLATHRLDHPLAAALLNRLGLRPGSRCLLLGSTEGEPGFARNLARRIGRICRRAGALPAGGLPVRAWERGRFLDPYLRDDLLDLGIRVDTLECAAGWDALARVRRAVRAHCAARPRTLCLTHLSHGYAQGASLYFTFVTAPEAEAEPGPDPAAGTRAFQAGILELLVAQGATLSHHHGIGRMAAPFMEAHLGPVQMDLFRAIKHQLDPQNLMNPGGTLGLDRP
jgi:alkyldihydroxyacetonephosphate synthase